MHMLILIKTTGWKDFVAVVKQKYRNPGMSESGTEKKGFAEATKLPQVLASYTSLPTTTRLWHADDMQDVIYDDKMNVLHALGIREVVKNKK